MLTLFIIYIIGIVAAGLSNNIYSLIAARMLQGFSIASIPVAFSIIRDILPVKKLAIGIGIFTAAYNGGSVVGILVGASIIENLGWHSTFFSLIPISVLLAALIKRFVSVNPPIRLDEGESGERKENQRGQEKGNNNISRMKQEIKSQPILKSDFDNIGGNYDIVNSKVNKKMFW